MNSRNFVVLFGSGVFFGQEKRSFSLLSLALLFALGHKDAKVFGRAGLSVAPEDADMIDHRGRLWLRIP